MTIELCNEPCQGWAYIGVQYSVQCFCGNAYAEYGAANNCDMGCSGALDEICGGYWANSVWTVAPIQQRVLDKAYSNGTERFEKWRVVQTMNNPLRSEKREDVTREQVLLTIYLFLLTIYLFLPSIVYGMPLLLSFWMVL
jgi:hypothetical protein